jgi:hypothetical protein
MKNLIIFLGIVLIIFSCRKDPNLGICQNCQKQINSYSSAYFLEDAEQLAYRLISSDTSHVGHNQVELDQPTVDCYLGKLSAIFNAASAVDGSLHNMLNKWNVHIKYGIDLSMVGIKFTESSGLLDELLANPGNTSNDFLNELHNKYGFGAVYPPSVEDIIKIRSLKNHNTPYIKMRLQEFNEIFEVYIDDPPWDGPSIDHISYSDHDIFIFEFAWDNCFTGCLKSHYWKIKVDQDCSVSLMEEFGDDLPL